VFFKPLLEEAEQRLESVLTGVLDSFKVTLQNTVPEVESKIHYIIYFPESVRIVRVELVLDSQHPQNSLELGKGLSLVFPTGQLHGDRHFTSVHLLEVDSLNLDIVLNVGIVQQELDHPELSEGFLGDSKRWHLFINNKI